MVIVKLFGGLGNQMFQYACACSYSGKLYLDLDFLKTNNQENDNFTPRDYELDIFSGITARNLTSIQRRLFLSNNRFAALLRFLLHVRVNAVNEININNLLFRKWNIYYFNDYFQSENYFLNNREIIRKNFTFPMLDTQNQDLQRQIKINLYSVCVHVRRSDYLKTNNLSYHGVLDIVYYNKAIAHFETYLNEPIFFIFGDDYDFVKLNFGHRKNCVIVKNDIAWKDMALMSSCAHYVIANSTFSWWAAWLGESTDSVVVAPKCWFNIDKVAFDIDKIIPNRWLRF